MKSLFGVDLLERMAKTFLQVLLASLFGPGVADTVLSTPVPSVSGGQAMIMAAIGAALSVLTSVLSKQVGDSDSASLVVATDEVYPGSTHNG